MLLRSRSQIRANPSLPFLQRLEGLSDGRSEGTVDIHLPSHEQTMAPFHKNLMIADIDWRN